jgi:hypothetical protein
MRKLLAVPAALFLGLAPVVHASPGGDQAGLDQPFSSAGGPYVGKWGAHGEAVTVNSDGSGVETSNYGTTTFMMTFVSTDQPITASGNVTGGAKQGGGYVTMQLVDSGNGMLFSMGGGDQNFPFCKVVGGGYANNADCGA